MTGVIDLLRHGEVDGALCLGGGCDAPLNAAGWARMRAVCGDATPPWQAIASSPLSRCAAYARELAGQRQLPLTLDPRLSELGFGAWEGQPWDELYATHGEALRAFQRAPGRHPAPGGEHYADFERRVNAAWLELGEAVQSQHWLVVCHAGVIRAILRQVLDIPLTRLFHIEVPHGCLTRLALDEEGAARLVFHGPRP
jgi:alpha-ribazole phosphatase/probable phosphoglycerate mutase